MKRKTIISAALILALMLCLGSAAAYAAPKAAATPTPSASASAKPSPTPGVDPTAAPDADSAEADAEIADLSGAVVNASGETMYNDGDTVFNNFGTVYNNGGVVYNNGGTVYNNDGTVYNNGGIVYNNGALVYNNNGTVYNNDGSVEEAMIPAMSGGAEDNAADEKTASAKTSDSGEKAASAQYEITLAGDYGDFVDISGLEKDKLGNYYITEDGKCTVTPLEGVTITAALTTAGACEMDDEGNVTLEKVDRDGELTLKFTLEAPVISPASASYEEDQTITITAAECADIYYTLDGSTPTAKSLKYNKPFEIEESTVVKAIAAADGAETSETAEETYVYAKMKNVVFASAAVGYAQPDAKAIYVENTGLADLVIESVELVGADKDSFTLSTEEGGVVASGQSDSKTWTVTPKKGLASGKYEAVAVFTFDSGETEDVDISFTVRKGTAKTA